MPGEQGPEKRLFLVRGPDPDNEPIGFVEGTSFMDALMKVPPQHGIEDVYGDVSSFTQDLHEIIKYSKDNKEQ